MGGITGPFSTRIKEDSCHLDINKITILQKIPENLETCLCESEGCPSWEGLEKGVPVRIFDMIVYLGDYGTLSLPLGSDKKTAEAEYDQRVVKLKEGKYGISVLGCNRMTIKFL